MRQVRQIMGMPITIDIPGCNDNAVFERAFNRFRQIDKRFSTFKPNSEVSRLQRGELAEKDASPELKTVIEACRRAEKWTNGYFSARAAGIFDPSGYVKGWAIAESGKVIENQSYGTYCISAGGDILARSSSGKIWHIGIQNPTDKSKILNKLSISRGAIATSGNYERGAHIINPKTGQPAVDFLSVTIVGPEIIKADILATAVFAMSKSGGAEFMKQQEGYQALWVSPRSRESNR